MVNGEIPANARETARRAVPTPGGSAVIVRGTGEMARSHTSCSGWARRYWWQLVVRASPKPPSVSWPRWGPAPPGARAPPGPARRRTWWEATPPRSSPSTRPRRASPPNPSNLPHPLSQWTGVRRRTVHRLAVR
ncbi:hypothetical protein ACFFX0_28420 [Citricoccus parietis]|uniref:Uncharacterized protein n=1 Tax=Citricoccus parietis TaxID=592307 RepID=A0ABV5G7G9_9MICC